MQKKGYLRFQEKDLPNGKIDNAGDRNYFKKFKNNCNDWSQLFKRKRGLNKFKKKTFKNCYEVYARIWF